MKFHGSGNVSSNILTMDAHGYSAGLHVPKLIGYIEHPKNYRRTQDFQRHALLPPRGDHLLPT